MNLPDDIALRLAVHEAAAPLSLDALPPGERDRVGGFGSEKRRREFALGRTTARALLADHLAVAAPDVPLRVAADGAPELDGGRLHVSIAHAATSERTLAAAAVSPRPVGVDLEVIRPRRADLYRFMLHPDEYGLLETLPHDHDAAQILVWTLKEATLKAMRTGFRVSPKKLRLSVDPERQAATVSVEEGGSWSLVYDQRDGCFVAVAF
ncbi:MAG: 4'-phosphopantetheinyl transferase superfamily protein [Rhodothermales bacterium]